MTRAGEQLRAAAAGGLHSAPPGSVHTEYEEVQASLRSRERLQLALSVCKTLRLVYVLGCS